MELDGLLLQEIYNDVVLIFIKHPPVADLPFLTTLLDCSNLRSMLKEIFQRKSGSGNKQFRPTAYTGEGVGRLSSSGSISWRGSIFYKTSSSGKLGFLIISFHILVNIFISIGSIQSHFSFIGWQGIQKSSNLSEPRLWAKLNTIGQCNDYGAAYSKSKFGTDAEVITALHMMSRDVNLSKGSRGPADLFASKESSLWYVQVKASTKASRIKGSEIKRLSSLASAFNAYPIMAAVQPSLRLLPNRTFSFTGLSKQEEQNQEFGALDPFYNFSLSFYHIPSWRKVIP